MSFFKRSLSRRPSRRGNRVIQQAVEALESRQLLTVLFPHLSYDSIGVLGFDADTHVFNMTAKPLSLQTGLPYPFPISNGTVTMQVGVDATGKMIANSASNTFVVTGTINENDPLLGPIDLNGDGAIGLLTGTLLSGHVALGTTVTNSYNVTTSSFDFTFITDPEPANPADWRLNHLFGSKFDVDVQGSELGPNRPFPAFLNSVARDLSTSLNSGYPLFAGSFTKDFAAAAQGGVTPIPQGGGVDPASIGNYVWIDSNANGVQDNNENGLDGVTVKLVDGSGNPVLDINGTPVQPQVTSNGGLYKFTNLVPGTYAVQFVAPGGYSFTTANVGSDSTDSDANTLTGKTGNYTLTSGQYDDTVDAGLYLPASIGNYVWIDSNANGVQDNNENGLDGVTVKLVDGSGNSVLDINGNPVQPQVTSNGGLYKFINLVPGTYAVQFVAPGGYSFTTANVGNDSADSDASTATGKTGNYTLTSGQYDDTVDAGLYLPASIGNYVWLDANVNGTQDSGENGVDGVTVKLVDGSGNPVVDINGNPVQPQTTSNGGLYKFTNLVPGTYSVQFVAPSGYSITTPNVGSDSTDSDADVFTGKTGNYTLASGEYNDTVDAGLYNPLPGITMVKNTTTHVVKPYEPVTYTYTVTNTGGTSFAAADVSVKDDNGTPNYAADDFYPGPVLSGGFNVGDLNHNNFLDPLESWTYSATIIPVVTMTSVVNGTTVTAGAEIISTVQANGNVKVTYLQDFGVNDNTYGTGSIGWGTRTHAFSDLVGSDHLEFRFYAANGTVPIDFYVDTITQAASVSWNSVDGPKSYSYPAGYGTMGVFGAEGYMVAGNSQYILGFSTSITTNLNNSLNLPNKTALMTNSPTSLVSGNVVVDNTKAPGGWDYINSYTVEVSAQAFAAAGGFYSVVVPDQHNSPSKLGVNQITTTPTDSVVTNTGVVVARTGPTTTISASDTETIRIATALGSIGDFVWSDINKNGKQDAGELGISDVVVTLLDNANNVLGTDITDGDGHYLFDHLPTGQYQLKFTLPSGYTFTVADAGTNNAIDSDVNPSTGITPIFSLAAGANDLTWDAGLIPPPVPGPQIVKDYIVPAGHAASFAPFEPVTYTYAVSNTGSVPLTNVVVKDDNGTPDFAADDFSPTYQSGDTHNLGQLDPDETWLYRATVIPPVSEYAVVNNVTMQTGTLIAQVLPAGDIKLTYLQSQSINDNRYGTGATAATGWTNGHKFGDLTGSDEAEFALFDNVGTKVLDFKVDCITAATKATFPVSTYVPTGTVNYPSGYGTLGVTGGDGGMVTGSASNILFASTSITTNLNQSPTFYGYTVNSPAETSPYSNVSVPAGWDYTNSYTVIVSKAAFGTGTFGTVAIAGQHNSPPKVGSNLLIPSPGNGTVINNGTVTAFNGTRQLSASDTASVQIQAASTPSQGKVVAGATTISTNKLTVPLTNKGTTKAVISKITVNWPSADGKLQKIYLAGKVLFDTVTAPGSVTVTNFKGTTGDRSIDPGKAKSFVLQFEKNAVLTGYTIDITFTDGSVLHMTV